MAEDSDTQTEAEAAKPEGWSEPAAAAPGGQGPASGDGAIGSERILNQEEIDSLLGFNLADITLNENSGIRAIIDSAMVSY